MRRYITGVLAAVFLLLTVWCYLESALTAKSMESDSRTVTVLNQIYPLTKSQVISMQEVESGQEQPFDFTAWREQPGVRLENELGNTAQVPAVIICGRSSLLFGQGVWLDADDSKGCLIDKKTARSLFGSCDVTGLTLKCGDSNKIIRGVLSEVEDVVVFQAEDAEAELDHITVQCGAQQSRRQVESEFMSRHGMNGSILETETLSGAAQILIVILPIAVGIRLIKMICRILKNRLAAFLICGLIAAACLWILLTQIQIPADMLPTKWSDFSFWSSLWEKERQSILLLLLSEKEKPLQSCVEQFTAVLQYTFFACGFWWITCFFQKRLSFHAIANGLSES